MRRFLFLSVEFGAMMSLWSENVLLVTWMNYYSPKMYGLKILCCFKNIVSYLSLYGRSYFSASREVNLLGSRQRIKGGNGHFDSASVVESIN